MIIRKCDRCGEVFYPSSYYESIHVPVEVYESRRGGSWRDGIPELHGMKEKKMDLCGKCIEELEELIRAWLPVKSADSE